MGDFNYVNPPGAGSLAFEATPTGTDVEQNWFFPVSGTPISLEVINGHLTSPNLGLLQKFKKYHVQRGALSTGSSVGATANLDYFWDQFGALDKLYTGGVLTDRQWIRDENLIQYYSPIPGANIEFYNPYAQAKVLLNWNIIWYNDGFIEKPLPPHGCGEPVPPDVNNPMNNAQANITKVQMFYTTSPNQTEQELDDVGNRKCPPHFIKTDYGECPLPIDNIDNYWPWGGLSTHLNAMGCRSWSGHKLVTLVGKGWYSAGLRLVFAGNSTIYGNSANPSARDEAIYQSRVRTRSMRYILFKS